MIYYWNLSQSAQNQLLHLPESGMGFQIVDANIAGKRTRLIVLDGVQALDLDASGIVLHAGREQAFANGLSLMAALQEGVQMTQFASFSPTDFQLVETRIGLPNNGLTSVATASTSSSLVTPSALVKTVTLTTTRVFHRFSAFNPDRRVDPATGNFLPGTYAVPESEVQFLKTGFAAVGRLALPNVSPASNHYEIDAPAGTIVKFGTVAPAFGQAGGGVEAYFAGAVINSKSPPNYPTVIPDE